MKQKTVMKVQMNCDKCRTKAMEIAAVADGVASVAIQGPDKDQVVVIGEGIDSASLVVALRKKVGYTTLVSVEEVKPPKPEPDKKPDPTPIQLCYQFPPPCPPPYDLVCYTDPTPRGCSIM